MSTQSSSSSSAQGALRRVLGLALRHRALVAGAGLAALGLSLARLYLTWLIKTWAEAIESPRNLDLGPLVGIASLVAVGLVVCIHLSRYLPAIVDQRVIEELRNRAVNTLLLAHPRRSAAFASGELVSRVQTDAGTLEGLTLQTIKQLVSPGLILAGSVALMIRLDWRLASAVLLGVPLAAGALAIAGRAIRRAAGDAQAQAGRLSAGLVEQVQGLVTVHTLGTADAELKRFHEHSAALRRHQLRSARWSALLVAVIWLVAAGALVLALWLGTQRVAAGALTSGGLLAFCLFAGQAVDALRNLGAYQGRLAQLGPAAERVFEVIDLPAEGAARPSSPIDDGSRPEDSNAYLEPRTRRRVGPTPEPLRGPLVLDRVTFAYSENDPAVLREVSLSLEPGETAAVVGATGAGKSTLVRLLLALHRPTAGRILLAGRELGTIPLDRLYRTVTFVPQEPFLFARSLRDNLVYGSPDTPADRLEQAIATVGLESLIDDAPAGLDTQVSELGGSLSGGQRQRLVLARALLRDPEILLLDEATSALDSETETAIWRRLEPWLAQRTVLVLAHRLATVRRVPRVLVLQGGRIHADGPSREVRDHDAFRRLFGDQLEAARESPPREEGAA